MIVHFGKLKTIQNCDQKKHISPQDLRRGGLTLGGLITVTGGFVGRALACFDKNSPLRSVSFANRSFLQYQHLILKQTGFGSGSYQFVSPDDKTLTQI